MNGIILEQEALSFMKKMDALRLEVDPKFPWYPYGTLNNFIHLKSILNKHSLDVLIGPTFKTLDIGAADGDMAFFLEGLGYKADIIDFPPTNFNHLRGARILKDRLNSRVNIFERDLDSQFPEIKEKYGLVFFLGILYHLKNPYFVLERLSRITQNLIVSTRIAAYVKDGTSISQYPMAYLLAPDESNNDSTNYWIFTYRGLERVFERSGWEITQMVTVGDTVHSNPSDRDHDERAFALLRSKNFNA